MNKSFEDILFEQIDREAPSARLFSGTEIQIGSSSLDIFKIAKKNIKLIFARSPYESLHLESQNRALEREKEAFSRFLRGFSDEKVKESFQFFFENGAREFIFRGSLGLKRDYRLLAKKFHPDMGKSMNSEGFLLLNEHYNFLKQIISRE